MKQDVVPGRYTTLWFEATEPGTLPDPLRRVLRHRPLDDARRGGRARRPTTTSAGSQAGRAAERRRPAYAEPPAGEPSRPSRRLVSEGERVAAEHGCLRCHTLDGTPHLGPTWAGLYGSRVPLDDGGQVVADEAYLTESMMDPLGEGPSRLPAGDAVLPRRAAARRGRGDRRVHQVAARRAHGRRRAARRSGTGPVARRVAR